MVITFPVNPAYASLNLAQAVLLCGYEWLKATSGDVKPFLAVERSPAAPRNMVLSFFDYLEGELERAGFFRPIGKKPVMQRNLRNIFHRMQMTEQDVRTLRGMFVRLVEGPRADTKGKDQASSQAPLQAPLEESSPALDSGVATLSSDLPSAATPNNASATAAKTIKAAPKR